MTRNIAIAATFTLLTAILLAGIFLREKPRLATASNETSATNLERGARDFEQYCATCHGLAGQGNVQYGAPRLNNIVARKTANGSIDGQFGVKNKYGTVRNYIEATLYSGIRDAAMPAFGAQGILRQDQIENITSYVLSWSSPVTDTNAGYQGLPDGVQARADGEATANAPTPDPNANPVDAGKLVFQANCSGCHVMTSQKGAGPGLGGLFLQGGTLAYGTTLPNGQPVSEDNVKTWIKGGAAGFPNVKTVDLQGQQYTQMPGFNNLSAEQFNNLITWLKVHDRDGKETADAAKIRQSKQQTSSPKQPGDNLPMTPIPTGQAQPNSAPGGGQQPTAQVNTTADAESTSSTATAQQTTTP